MVGEWLLEQDGGGVKGRTGTGGMSRAMIPQWFQCILFGLFLAVIVLVTATDSTVAAQSGNSLLYGQQRLAASAQDRVAAGTNRGRRYQWLFGNRESEPAQEPANAAVLQQFDRQVRQARKLYLAGDSEKAVLKYRSAIDRFESLVDALPAGHPLLAEMEKRFHVYAELATKIMGPLGGEPKASLAPQIFYLMEKRRISRRNLTMKKAGVTSFAGAPQSLLDEEARILTELTRVRQEAPSSANRRRQKELKNRLGGVRSALQRSSKRYALLRRGLPLSLAEVRRDLLGKNEVLLDFNLFRERMIVGVITGEMAVYHQVSVNLPDVARGVFMLQEKLREFTTGGKSSFMGHAWREPARRLYRTLLGKLPSLPEGKTTVLLIPDGPLWYLPFSLLLDPEDRPFGRERLLSMIPSADMLGFLRSLRRNGASQPEGGLLLIESLPWVSEEDAHRVFSESNNAKKGDGMSEGERIERIILRNPVYPKPSEIVRKIRGIFKKSYVHVGKAATTARFIKASQVRHVVSVLALPLAVTDSVSRGRQPAMFFSPGSGGGRVFSVSRFFATPLAAGLTVLPTAWFDVRGKTSARGEGPLLLATALAYAGSPLTLVNYANPGWGNDDPFLLTILKEIAGGSPPGKALAAYRRDMPAGLDSSFSGKPPAWAGWIVLGDPSSRAPVGSRR